jgi:DNA-binding NarL/FixJ family response regulator
MEIRILIADDQPIVRYGLWKLLSDDPDFQVVGDAENGTECFEKIGKLKPDVVILGLEMKNLREGAIIKSLRTQHPKDKLIVYSGHNTNRAVSEAIKMGVHGYVVKSSTTNNLKAAIRIVSQGERYLDPAATSNLMQTIELIEKQQLQHRMITERELEILKLVAKGYRNKVIAKLLFIAECTVKYHVSSILTKLSVSSRIEAALVAKELGMLHD